MAQLSTIIIGKGPTYAKWGYMHAIDNMTKKLIFLYSLKSDQSYSWLSLIIEIEKRN